ncbi:DUF6415 family natural product biosynthesis protein [Streptomyces longwoodensis]|uniref:DUF6415 family natural product biosynthesis protein n=1 Tax=Streptomyces longwoodensis TaxID=68231 RepID=UPI0033CBB1B3
MTTGRTRSATATTGAGKEQRPPDIAAIRASAGRALTTELSREELETLPLTLRGHIQRLIPAVAAAAAREPEDSVPRACARACIGEAHRKLRLGDGDTPLIRLSVVHKLARSANALCDHFENLGGATS